MPTVDFTRYYRYAEMTEALRAFADEYAALATLTSIGTSHEGATSGASRSPTAPPARPKRSQPTG